MADFSVSVIDEAASLIWILKSSSQLWLAALRLCACEPWVRGHEAGQTGVSVAPSAVARHRSSWEELWNRQHCSSVCDSGRFRFCCAFKKLPDNIQWLCSSCEQIRTHSAARYDPQLVLKSSQPKLHFISNKMSVTKPNHCDYSNINVNHMYSCFLEQKQESCTRILHCLLLLKYVVCLSGHEGIRFNIIPGRAGQFNKTANIIAGNVLSKQQKQASTFPSRPRPRTPLWPAVSFGLRAAESQLSLG